MKEIVARWSNASIEIVLNQLRSGSCPSVFGECSNGQTDLRGLPIAQVLRRISIQNVNLQHCRTLRAGQFLDCAVTNADLSKSTLRTNLDGIFKNCVFDASRMEKSLFRGTFTDCSFHLAKMRDCSASTVTFNACDFSNADLRGGHFDSCSFIECCWDDVLFGEGSFYRSNFFKSRPLSLGDSILDGTTFS